MRGISGWVGLEVLVYLVGDEGRAGEVVDSDAADGAFDDEASLDLGDGQAGGAETRFPRAARRRPMTAGPVVAGSVVVVGAVPGAVGAVAAWWSVLRLVSMVLMGISGGGVSVAA